MISPPQIPPKKNTKEKKAKNKTKQNKVKNPKANGFKCLTQEYVKNICFRFFYSNKIYFFNGKNIVYLLI